MNTLQIKISRIYILFLLLFLFAPSAVLAQKAKSMTNADVIEMVKAGLSEQIITTSIRQASARDFDLTPTGLIALKKDGMPDTVIVVMQEKGIPIRSVKFVTGKYIRKDKSNDYIDFSPDGTFSLQQDGKNYRGNYSVQENTITVQVLKVRETSIMRMIGNKLVQSSGAVWENPSEPENASVKLTNDMVIQLVKAGLSDQIIVTAIRQATNKDFDLTTTGLIALKKAEVSDAVIVGMLEKDTPATVAEVKTQQKEPTLNETENSAPTPVSQNGCSGIEAMGIYKNSIFSADMGGGVVEWLAKIRNNTSVTKIVVFGWVDMYGKQIKAQAQIKGGEISSLRLDMTQARVIAPVKELRLISCQ
jgi:hypothetical protein